MNQRIIVDIHPHDPRYKFSRNYRGKPITVKDDWQVWGEGHGAISGWEWGSCTIGGKDTIVHAIRTGPVQTGQEGGKSRTTPYGNLYKRKLRLRTQRT